MATAYINTHEEQTFLTYSFQILFRSMFRLTMEEKEVVNANAKCYQKDHVKKSSLLNSDHFAVICRHMAWEK